MRKRLYTHHYVFEDVYTSAVFVLRAFLSGGVKPKRERKGKIYVRSFRYFDNGELF